MQSRAEYRLRRPDPKRETSERALREIGAGSRPGPTLAALTAQTIRRAQYLMARKAFPTDTALAEAIGVHRSQITRWKAGDPASPENAWLLRDLAFAAETLAEHLDPAASHAWLHGRSPELGGETPLEAIRGGRVADVLMALQAQVGGAYF
ncbi:MAG TPA: CII family transcriptional regulator [Longimicrobium sp.]|jgi:hypothetical protein